MQQPPGAPPQWSADGQWWWDGTQWQPRSAVMPATPAQPGYVPPPPGYWMPPPPSPLAPSPGLRIFLIVVLAIAVLISSVFVLAGVSAFAGGANTSSDYTFAAVVAVLFAISVIALVGVSIRASWSRVAAILAGVVLSLTCLGSVLGIPIIVAAARAPNLTRPRSA